MIHVKRRFRLQDSLSPEQLAYDLTHRCFVLCTAFLLEDYVFLNDTKSIHEPAEYTVVKLGDFSPQQVHRITFMRCEEERALFLIRCVLLGAFDHAATSLSHALYIDAPEDHRCPLCA